MNAKRSIHYARFLPILAAPFCASVLELFATRSARIRRVPNLDPISYLPRDQLRIEDIRIKVYSLLHKFLHSNKLLNQLP